MALGWLSGARRLFGDTYSPEPLAAGAGGGEGARRRGFARCPPAGPAGGHRAKPRRRLLLLLGSVPGCFSAQLARRPARQTG